MTGFEAVKGIVVNDVFTVDADDAASAFDDQLEKEPFFRDEAGVFGAADAVERAGGIDSAFDVVNLDFVMGFVAGAFGAEEDAAVGILAGADVGFEGEILVLGFAGEMAIEIGAEDGAEGHPFGFAFFDEPVLFEVGRSAI